MCPLIDPLRDSTWKVYRIVKSAAVHATPETLVNALARAIRVLPARHSRYRRGGG
jgi:hypothetical protein